MNDPGEVVVADAVFVCTWTSEHRQLVARCVEAGRAGLCEKPLGVDGMTPGRVSALVEGYDPSDDGWAGAGCSSPAMLAVRELLGRGPGRRRKPDRRRAWGP